MSITQNDKNLTNTKFLHFALKEFRKDFSENDLHTLDQGYLLTCIANGATLADLKVIITAMLVRSRLVMKARETH